MKLLLDENLPKRLKLDFPEHEVFTVYEMGWQSVKNGALLQKMVDAGFDALLTFDKNLQYQQNFRRYSLTVFVLSAPDNTYLTLTQLSSKISLLLQGSLAAGPVVVAL